MFMLLMSQKEKKQVWDGTCSHCVEDAKMGAGRLVLPQQFVMKVKERVTAGAWVDVRSEFTMMHNSKPTVCIKVWVNKLFILFDPVKVKVEPSGQWFRDRIRQGGGRPRLVVFLQLALFKLQPACNQAAGRPQWWLRTSHASLLSLSFLLHVVHVLPATKAKESLWSLFEGKSSYF